MVNSTPPHPVQQDSTSEDAPSYNPDVDAYFEEAVRQREEKGCLRGHDLNGRMEAYAAYPCFLIGPRVSALGIIVLRRLWSKGLMLIGVGENLFLYPTRGPYGQPVLCWAKYDMLLRGINLSNVVDDCANPH